ncbi:MarR family transcriptional regulator [Actinoplanes sp. ATCC 53533]|jgi:MarR family 2-MHQ and catechol resistance regulon transcriptional repressor|uniref:MarR family winged helix-turn-helix transcriptional regulator n=1 Tax=Actinoplanes sp. ATCC 53533 TaxID=1288362 RepID=UPI000F788215|nr:MarR family transcriptional regulator [Actinoplanes sp. ATCC 53533]RSM43303.1 MarR family transcriptional regulator [Actinoplanes sp. ATCC 53533]
MAGVATDFDDPRLTAIGLFAEAFTGLSSRFAAQFEQHRVSPVEFEVLMRLARSPQHRLRMTDLAGQTSLSTSGVTRVVDRMDRGGLIRREACPSDRRSSFAVITEAGLARLEEILPGHLELVQRWFIGQLTPVQLEQTLGSLRTIRDAVNPCATAGSSEENAIPIVPAG